jgi:hypothetical protein
MALERGLLHRCRLLSQRQVEGKGQRITGKVEFKIREMVREVDAQQLTICTSRM